MDASCAERDWTLGREVLSCCSRAVHSHHDTVPQLGRPVLPVGQLTLHRAKLGRPKGEGAPLERGCLVLHRRR